MALHRLIFGIGVTLFFVPFEYGMTSPGAEHPSVQPDPRIMNRQQDVAIAATTPTSRGTFMQRILAKIQGTAEPTPSPTTISPKISQPLIVQQQPVLFYQPVPNFVYHLSPSPFYRKEKAERANNDANNFISAPMTTTANPATSTSTITSKPPGSFEKASTTVAPPRFHRGPPPTSDSGSISIPILRSDVETQTNKKEFKHSHQPKCYATQKSVVPLHNPFIFYPNQGFPFGNGNYQPNFNPVPSGNNFYPVPSYPRYPQIVYFILPQKRPTETEPFDLIAMEKNKNVYPVAAPPASNRPQTSFEPEFVEVTQESPQKGSVESPSLSSLSQLKPTPTAESSIEEIVEIDLDPASKPGYYYSATSPASEESKEKRPSRPIEFIDKKEVDDSKTSEIQSHLKTVDTSETESNGGGSGSAAIAPRLRLRKYKF